MTKSASALKNLVEQAFWVIKFDHKSIDEALEIMSRRYGLSKDGTVYNYLKSRLNEEA